METVTTSQPVGSPRRAPVAVSLLLAAVGLGVGAVAAFAQGSPTTHACVHPSSGNVRVVTPGQACRPPERSLQLGTQAGVPGYEIVTATSNQAVPPGARFAVNAECPGTKVAFGGGYSLGDAFNPSPELLVLESAPLVNNEGFPDGKFWRVEVKNVGANPSFFTVYAVCGLPTP